MRVNIVKNFLIQWSNLEQKISKCIKKSNINTIEPSDGFIGNKIADKTASKSADLKPAFTTAVEEIQKDLEILKETYIPPEKRQLLMNLDKYEHNI